MSTGLLVTVLRSASLTIAGMDIVAAAFSEAMEAASAASDLTSVLHLDPDLVTVGPVAEGNTRTADAEQRTVPVIVMAWARGHERRSARDLLSRHHGRHVPFAWVTGMNAPSAAPAVLVSPTRSLTPLVR